jgi:hypothetical protein
LRPKRSNPDQQKLQRFVAKRLLVMAIVGAVQPAG